MLMTRTNLHQQSGAASARSPCGRRRQETPPTDTSRHKMEISRNTRPNQSALLSYWPGQPPWPRKRQPLNLCQSTHTPPPPTHTPPHSIISTFLLPARERYADKKQRHWYKTGTLIQRPSNGGKIKVPLEDDGNVRGWEARKHKYPGKVIPDGIS